MPPRARAGGLARGLAAALELDEEGEGEEDEEEEETSCCSCARWLGDEWKVDGKAGRGAGGVETRMTSGEEGGEGGGREEEEEAAAAAAACDACVSALPCLTRLLARAGDALGLGENAGRFRRAPERGADAGEDAALGGEEKKRDSLDCFIFAWVSGDFWRELGGWVGGWVGVWVGWVEFRWGFVLGVELLLCLIVLIRSCCEGGLARVTAGTCYSEQAIPSHHKRYHTIPNQHLTHTSPAPS